jgi:hypothetical protein
MQRLIYSAGAAWLVCLPPEVESYTSIWSRALGVSGEVLEDRPTFLGKSAVAGDSFATIGPVVHALLNISFFELTARTDDQYGRVGLVVLSVLLVGSQGFGGLSV